MSVPHEGVIVTATRAAFHRTPNEAYPAMYEVTGVTVSRRSRSRSRVPRRLSRSVAGSGLRAGVARGNFGVPPLSVMCAISCPTSVDAARLNAATTHFVVTIIVGSEEHSLKASIPEISVDTEYTTPAPFGRSAAIWVNSELFACGGTTVRTLYPRLSQYLATCLADEDGSATPALLSWTGYCWGPESEIPHGTPV